MLLSEGKEEQAYQRCQSSKKHIYKIVTEGHKHLNFYSNSPRMVPSHILPQPDKICLKKDDTETPAVFSHGFSKSKKGSQSKSTNFPGFSSAASGLKDHGYLSKEELNVWTKKYCMSQKDTEAIQRRLSTYTGKREMLSLRDEGENKGIYTGL